MLSANFSFLFYPVRAKAEQSEGINPARRILCMVPALGLMSLETNPPLV